MLPSKLQAECINPQRFIIAHPFNPVYILPLVEIVKGNKTSNIYFKRANTFYKEIKMKTLLVEKEQIDKLKEEVTNLEMSDIDQKIKDFQNKIDGFKNKNQDSPE